MTHIKQQLIMIRKTHKLYLKDTSEAEMAKIARLIAEIDAYNKQQEQFNEYVTAVSKEQYVLAEGKNSNRCFLIPKGYAIKAKGLSKIKFGLFVYSFVYDGVKYVSMKGKKTGEFFGYVMAKYSKESKPKEIPAFAIFNLDNFTKAVNGDKVYVKKDSKLHTFIYDSGIYLTFQDVLNAIEKQKKNITCVAGQDFYDTHANLEGVDLDVVSQIASMICYLGGDAVKEYNLEAYKGLNNFEKLLHGETPNVFKVNPDDYVAYLVGLTTALERFVNADGKVMAIKDAGKMRDFIKALRHEEIKKFSLDKKVHILRILSNGILTGYFGNMGESRVLEVLRAIKPSEELKFLNKIAIGGLVYKLINKLDGGNFTDLSFSLTLMVLNNKPIPSLEELGVYSTPQVTKAGYENKKLITYHQNAFKEDRVFRSHSESSRAQFRISWHSDQLFSKKENPNYTSLKFDDFVVLDIGKQGLKYLGIEGKTQIIVPGVFLHWILRQQEKEDTWAKARLTVEVIFTLLSLGEYAAARTAIAAIVAATDVAVGVGAIFIDGSDMRHNKEYKEFVAVWDKFLMVYGIGRGLSILAKISPQRLEQFKKTFNKYKDKIKPKYRKQVETGFTEAQQKYFLEQVHPKVGRGNRAAKKEIKKINKQKKKEQIVNKTEKIFEKRNQSVANVENELSHGSTKTAISDIKENGVDLSKNRQGLDFNSKGERAFYVHDNIADTEKYIRRMLRDPKHAGSEMGHVKFKIPKEELNKLNIKIFDDASPEWIKFVTDARKGTLKHDYDIVIGPKLANPLQVIRKGEEASPLMSKSGKIDFQIAFTSQKGVDILNKYIRK